MPETKTCIVCGREMQWRKKWARTWDEVRHCSDACRRRGVKPLDVALEAAILERLAALPRGRSLPLDDVARTIDDAARPVDPQRLRSAARRLHACSELVISQSGHRVDPSTAKGPFDVGRP